MKILFALLLLSVVYATTNAQAAPESPSVEPVAAIAPEKLSRDGLSDEAYAFKQQVYRLHVERGTKSGRTRIFDLPPAELALIPGTQIQMRRDAAKALGNLLSAARENLACDLMAPAGDKKFEERKDRARRVKELGINNAYRSASHQFEIWNRNFLRYYQATAKQRLESVGGQHGAAAAELLREYIGIRVAAPGFSNHQGGIAVDFALSLKPDTHGVGKTLGASTEQGDAWKESWFWRWLKERAGEFGFVEYEPEEWHWEYKPEQAAGAEKL